MTLRLDVSVGPVQGFVAQSRRTRDLWGSSYLLSFLSAHAMHAAQQAGGRVVQPLVDADPLYLWARGEREGDAPRIGSVPNHFVVEVDGDASEVARASVRGLEVAWERVCSAVWERFVEHGCTAGDGTEQIWMRQVHDFWEVMWTAGPLKTPGALLARRKHWRTHRLPDEPGDKCTVMHDLQELSGYVRAESRTNQDDFWRLLRARVGPLDLREDERLCAVALVKRLFPKVATSALGWSVDAAHWPSTVYVGAVPWIQRAVLFAPQEAKLYAERVRQDAPSGALAERQPMFSGLDETAAGDFPRLDANYFHRGFLEDERLCPLAADSASGIRTELIRLLADVQSVKNDAGRRVGPPPTFYALLLADGDRLGRLVGTMGGEAVGQALAAFTRDVPGIVQEHDGVTVYAGGDDVLAMLPVA
ncbi:MAG: type III-B CRISPR-associated protein Cas10/Cmr2, partial [Armatimonadetes bacterium]|nr:type III-B CRISPR-associated protein Cas10/Cmr2 [Armatimonadota bacterium]